MKKILLIVLFTIPFLVSAQEITVSGVVKSKELNETLPGVTVQIKGSSVGVITNTNGEFSIRAAIGDVLVFSFVGMIEEEIKVKSETINLDMMPNIELLQEVEVVSQGYFNISKEALTGSTAQISNSQLSSVRTNSIEGLLEGQVSGVVVSESAEPGGSIGINIRGSNSILGGTQPLYVVDGIPIDPSEDAQGNSGSGEAQSSLSFLNPNDIEKVEILKDAASTAIYGARGANGVVVITTKSGDSSKGRDAFSVVVDQTFTEINNKIDVLDGPGYEAYMNQRAINQLYFNLTNPNRSGVVFDGTQALNVANFPELEGFRVPYPSTTGVSTDWQDLAYRMAHSNQVSVSYGGGRGADNFQVSLGFLQNEGVIINSDFNRATANFNVRRKVGTKLDIFSKTNLARSWGNAASTGNGEIFQQRGVVSQTLLFQPIFGPLEEGEDDIIYASLNDGDIVSNPVTLANELVDRKEAVNILQSLSANYKISPVLDFTLKGAYNYQKNARDMYYPSTTVRGRRNNGEASQAFLEQTKYYLEGNLRFQKRIRKKHGLDAILIGTIEQNQSRRQFNRAFGFGNDATSFYTFESATDILVPISLFNSFALLSGVSRVSYNYQRKFFVDFNGRVDASSKFAKNRQTAFFPSASMAYILSKEQFMNSLSFVSFLKLRASYGQSGSNPIAPFQSLALLDPIRYNFNNNLAIGYFESNLANDNLTWETTEQFNVGFDLNLFDAKLQVTADAYLKTTKDLLQQVNLPPSDGYATRIDNFGIVENKGIELTLNYEVVNKADFQWNAMANISVNRNKLVELNSSLDFQLGPVVGFARTYPIIFMEGRPLGIFWGAQTNGVYRDWAEAIASGISGAAPGEIRYVNRSVDLDQNGNPLASQQINFDDFVQIGDPNPDFTAAFSNNFTYKKWDLNFLFTGQKGGDIFWVDSWQLTGMNSTRNVLRQAFEQSWRAPFVLSGEDGNALSYDPAAGNMENALHPAPALNTGQRVIPSDRQVYDGSFIRLKNINLGYTVFFKGGQSLRLYVSGRNLWTLSSFPGYDPDVQTYNKDPQRRGIDFGAYPGIRSYISGLKLNF
jgi:TonB-dependent starch-binding outer membrane protein SusC